MEAAALIRLKWVVQSGKPGLPDMVRKNKPFEKTLIVLWCTVLGLDWKKCSNCKLNDSKLHEMIKMATLVCMLFLACAAGPRENQLPKGKRQLSISVIETERAFKKENPEW
jgi:hypothetical protein